MHRRFQFRHLGSRLLVLLAGMLAITQGIAYLLVAQAQRRQAVVAIEEALTRGSRQFRAIANQREEDLLLAARMMAGDYALRQLFLIEDLSPATVRSALFSYKQRIGAPVIVMLDVDGKVLADTQLDGSYKDHTAFDALLAQAEMHEDLEATGWGYVEEILHQIVMVPVLAPPPEPVAWIGVGFPINQATAAALKDTANLEVSFVSDLPSHRVLASTLPERLQPYLAARGERTSRPSIHIEDLAGESYVTTLRRLDSSLGERVWIVLQRSLDAELAPARLLENILLLTSALSLAVAVLASLALARSFTRPVRQLATHTARIAAGDYTTRIDLDRADELGQLADAFNAMSHGLAERDRVRDLLDKNVSPEVAAQLMRDGATLGGEERLVTVVFADLRGFTPLSEQLPPRELVGLLNRYLDVMSAAIEAHGGIIDKYIGDEIMALFGAPQARPDDADRAVQAALAMRAALADFNAELAAAGQPPLAFGVGINSGHVIAGNVGSARRLNYTVLGDGVNLAARLQPLTRRPEFATDIILSEETRLLLQTTFALRDLGTVEVKGKTTATRIWAVDGRA